ncbi:MAG: hypothetical protein QXT64_05055, partial [Desulfurococcaceae archaeon]
MIGKALVSGLSIALSVVLVLIITVTPLLQGTLKGYGVGEDIGEAGIVIPVNYTVYYECPGGNDPFAGA